MGHASEPSAANQTGAPGVHETCSEFQSLFEQGDRPSLSEFLNRCRADDRPLAFTWLLAIELRQLRNRGETPVLSSYERLFPEFTVEIQRAFAGIRPPEPASQEETKSFRIQDLADQQDLPPDETVIAVLRGKDDSGFKLPDGQQVCTDGGNRAFLHYRVIARLGRGGMGEVLLAEDTLLGRRVALKLMRPELSANPDFKERFFREARAMAAVDHPNIIPIYQIGEEGGTPFLSMPYLQGQTLGQRIAVVKKLPEDTILKLLEQAADGLAAVHAAGLVHRDIKPSNLWLVPESSATQSETFKQVRILDFGLVRVEDGGTSMTGSQDILGTVNYMAPEQATKNRVDARSDLFSLGVVAYEAITGSHPFVRATAIQTLQAVVSALPRAPRFMERGVSLHTSDLIMQLLEKNPEKRPQSAQDLTRLLGRIRARHTAALRQEPVLARKTELLSEGERRKESTPSILMRWISGVNPVYALIALAAISVVGMFGMVLNELNSGGRWGNWTNRNARNAPTAPQNTEAALVSADAGDRGVQTDVEIIKPPEAAAPNTPVERPVSESPTKVAHTPTSGASDRSPLSNPVDAAVGTLPAQRHNSGVSTAVQDESYRSEETLGDRITPFSSEILDALLADEGRLLLVRTRGAPEILVYATDSGTLVRSLLLPSSEFKYAAGNQTLLIYLTEFQELELWDLKSFERSSSRDIRDLGIVTSLTMNAKNGNHAIVRLSGSERVPVAGNYLLDAQSLQLVEKDGKPAFIPSRYTWNREAPVQRTNSDFTVITEWSPRTSPSGVGISVLKDGSYRQLHDHSSQWFVVPADHGVIYSGSGRTYGAEQLKTLTASTFDIPTLTTISGTPLIPTMDGEFAIGISIEGALEVFQKGRTVPICTAGLFPKWNLPPEGGKPVDPIQGRQRSEFREGDVFAFDHRIWTTPSLNYMLLIPESNDRVIRRDFSLQTLLEGTDKPFLVVTSSAPRSVVGGRSWAHVLKVASDSSPVSFTLTEGPEGMTIDDQGVLNWAPPDGITGRVPVSVRLENPSQQRTLFRFIIELNSAPPQSQSQILQESFQGLSRTIDRAIEGVKRRLDE